MLTVYRVGLTFYWTNMTKQRLGFYNHASNKPNATLAMTISVREFYPNAPFVMGCDNSHDYSDMARQFNCVYYHNYTSIGYAPNPTGYSLEQIMMYLDRMYIAVTTLDTEYFMMLEDDVIILGEVDIPEGTEALGFMRDPRPQAGQLDARLIDMITAYSGVRPRHDQYNCAGGTIFRSDIFIDNFARLRQWFAENSDNVKKFYPTIGYIDCFMFIWWLLAGKSVESNHALYNIDQPFGQTNRNFDLTTVPTGYTIVHNYKNYY